jgi:hypothetical protein
MYKILGTVSESDVKRRMQTLTWCKEYNNAFFVLGITAIWLEVFTLESSYIQNWAHNLLYLQQKALLLWRYLKAKESRSLAQEMSLSYASFFVQIYSNKILVTRTVLLSDTECVVKWHGLCC